MASRMLAAQAIALDSMFAELARRTANNMGEYVNAAERYGRLALKAQSNCRATLETLAKLHQPREQTVKHFHVNEGRKPWSSIISTNIRGGRNLKIQTDNPTQPARLAQAPRCLARARSGTECQSPAKGGKRRCRMHVDITPALPPATAMPGSMRRGPRARCWQRLGSRRSRGWCRTKNARVASLRVKTGPAAHDPIADVGKTEPIVRNSPAPFHVDLAASLAHRLQTAIYSIRFLPEPSGAHDGTRGQGPGPIDPASAGGQIRVRSSGSTRIR